MRFAAHADPLHEPPGRVVGEKAVCGDPAYAEVLEAVAQELAYGFGRPVVAYPVGGLAEAVIDGETGWLCAKATPSALAAVLREAESAGREELRRRGEAGRRWAIETLDWGAIAASTETVYASVLRSGSAERRA